MFFVDFSLPNKDSVETLDYHYIKTRPCSGNSIFYTFRIKVAKMFFKTEIITGTDLLSDMHHNAHPKHKHAC